MGMHQFSQDGLSHGHIRGLLPEATSLAFRTNGFSPVAGEHDPVLNLVFLLFQVIKEAMNSFEMPVPVPQELPLRILAGHRGCGWENRNWSAFMTRLFFPLLHLLSLPAYHGILIDRKSAYWE
jgi:hypothetical protein